MSFEIKPATQAETPLLLEMIRELARFEELEHTVEATVESLDQAWFGPNPAAGALLAWCDGRPAGYAIYFFTFSSFTGRPGIWLDDVYVRTEFRRQGIGLGLIRAVARIGGERGCARYEWSALNWNRNALAVYRGLGARTMDDWVLLRLDAEGLRRVAGQGAA